jgi:hypothetical protein
LSTSTSAARTAPVLRTIASIAKPNLFISSPSRH